MKTHPRGEGPTTPTPRQMEVLRAQFRYGSRKDAADALGIGRDSIRTHLHNLYQRLGVETLQEATYRLWLRDLWGDR